MQQCCFAANRNVTNKNKPSTLYKSKNFIKYNNGLSADLKYTIILENIRDTLKYK